MRMDKRSGGLMALFSQGILTSFAVFILTGFISSLPDLLRRSCWLFIPLCSPRLNYQYQIQQPELWNPAVLGGGLLTAERKVSWSSENLLPALIALALVSALLRARKGRVERPVPPPRPSGGAHWGERAFEKTGGRTAKGLSMWMTFKGLEAFLLKEDARCCSRGKLSLWGCQTLSIAGAHCQPGPALPSFL